MLKAQLRDISLDILMPHKVRQLAALRSESAQVHNLLHTGVQRGVQGKLAVDQHVDGVTRAQEKLINVLHGGRDAGCIGIVQRDRFHVLRGKDLALCQ